MLLLLLAPALSAPDRPAAAGAPDRLRREIEFNGPALSGIDLGAGRSLRVVPLRDGVEGTGRPGAGVREAEGALRAAGGADRTAALLAGLTTDGKGGRLRIDGAQPAPDSRPATPENENGAVTLYRVSVQEGSWVREGGRRTFAADGGWRPLCPGEDRALVLAGRWDYQLGQRGDSGRRSSDPAEATFACEGGALAKCVLRLGYKPWRGTAYDALRQACVRALRADYCGDGKSLTRERVEVNIYDRAGVVADTADWTPQGARCVSSTRLAAHSKEARLRARAFIAQRCRERWSPQPCVPPQKTAGQPAIRWTAHKP